MGRVRVLFSLVWLLTNAVEQTYDNTYRPLKLAPLHSKFFEPSSCNLVPEFLSLQVDSLCVNEAMSTTVMFASRRIDMQSDQSVTMSVWVGANCSGRVQILDLGRDKCVTTNRIYWNARGFATYSAYSTNQP